MVQEALEYVFSLSLKKRFILVIDEYPYLEKDILNSELPDGYYLGEFTIGDAFHAMNRFEGNGILNRKDCPEDDIHFTVWDYLSLKNYENCLEPYKFRIVKLQALQFWFPDWMSIVDSHVAQNMSDIIKYNSQYMNQGLEGSVIKLIDYVFKNGTSNQQFKLKLKVDADVRITGTTKGEGKYSDTIGAITGGLAGCYYGYDNIPTRFIEAIPSDIKKMLDTIIEAIPN